MAEPYLPKADFIVMAANGEVPLTGSALADQNLQLLISFMSDADVSNRDWATMTLAMQDIDTPMVRNALFAAAEDQDSCVRAEALEGLADRNRDMALPLLQRELMRDECGYATFKAARSIAHPSLLAGLRNWRRRGGAPWIDDTIGEAIAACEAALASND
jgi:hypothetical protein